MEIDYTGYRFGRWTVLQKGEPRISSNGKSKETWVCVCICGNSKSVPQISLLDGSSQSCGCLRRERLSKGASEKNRTHGMTDTRLYRIYKHMICRCTNKNDLRYDRYGGRGISVCAEWSKFEPFCEWAISHGYNDSLSIDRIDIDGNYCPENCRWATVTEQANNKSNNQLYTYDSRTMTIGQWASEYDIPYKRLWKRLHNGWDIERALFEPPQPRS